MIDFTFRIVAKPKKVSGYPKLVDVSIDGVGSLLFALEEWQAFKSLLHPSIEADFSITELNEKGEPIHA